MLQLLFLRLGVLLVVVTVISSAHAAPQRPPLIDRELFLTGDSEISGAQLSPDGKYIAFLKPWNKTRNIWVKRREEDFNAARRLTSDTKRPITSFFWSQNGKFILFVQDADGDENYNIYVVNPADPPVVGAAAPTARNLSRAKGVRTEIVAVPESAPGILYAGFNDRDKAWHDLYEVNLTTGERKLVRQNNDRITGWIFDNKDHLRLVTRSANNGDKELLRVDPDGITKIHSCTVLETCYAAAFEKEDKKVYFVTNKGESDLTVLSLLDPQTGTARIVESDPQKRVDLGELIISQATHELVGALYDDEKLRIHWRNKEWEADYQRVEKQAPGKEIRLLSSTADERVWVISATADTEPGEVYLFDRNTKRITLQYRSREKLRRPWLAEMKPVRYESSDGLEIPAYLTLPKGMAPKNLPAIVLPHGGPWSRDNWNYGGFTQFLANRGYAVLQPNFRGSTGYGKKFLDAGNLQWGQKMQDDVTWGARFLVQKGIADPQRIGIVGASYGGYATLAGVAFTPGMYAAAVDAAGPSNLLTWVESIPPFWEAARAMFYKRIGDPRTPEGKEQLERQSPLNSADKIKTPLLVVQGANDPRIKKREADQMVVALRDRGFSVEYLVVPDEGHGFTRPINNLALLAVYEKFLAKHLGGRSQQEITPEVAARVKEITIDPKTVTVTPPSDASTLRPAR